MCVYLVLETLFKALLLIPMDFSLLEKRISQAGMTLAATSGKTLYVVREYFDPSESGSLRTLAHEFTHVLQYIHIEQPSIESMDERLAWTAFIEGEADLVADIYQANLEGKHYSQPILPQLITKPEYVAPDWVLDQKQL